MLCEHDYKEQQVHRAHICETVKLIADLLLPLYPMVDEGIYVHFIDPDLIQELLDILLSFIL